MLLAQLTLAGVAAPIAGGALIGLAASLMLLTDGRIAGISGIVGGSLERRPERWRLAFLAGIALGGLILSLAFPAAIAAPVGRPLILVGLAGLVVGYGTRMGNGCTSGHGVCGLSRRSRRSFTATLTFMAAGAASATLLSAIGVGS